MSQYISHTYLQHAHFGAYIHTHICRVHTAYTLREDIHTAHTLGKGGYNILSEGIHFAAHRWMVIQHTH